MNSIGEYMPGDYAVEVLLDDGRFHETVFHRLQGRTPPESQAYPTAIELEILSKRGEAVGQMTISDTTWTEANANPNRPPSSAARLRVCTIAGPICLNIRSTFG